jgi:NAD(P)H-quinone oxidoreductase subunit 5
MALNVLEWGFPAALVLGFFASMLAPTRAWSIATLASSIAVISVVLSAALQLSGLNQGADWRAGGWPLTWTVSTLIAVLGWVIVRFSRTYLNGEANQPRYVRALLFTLAAVSVVVVSRDLLVLVLGWAATSFGLHHLLTFYPERLPAQVAAHKKFIASRLAEALLIAALGLIYWQVGSFSFEAIAAAARNTETLSVALHAGAAFLALAVVVKSAQLPLHGWLIQVMEAPTPVSALLHAGVINLGGFVLIRTAELLQQAWLAQAILVVFGALTAVLAGLVMMTRISIKVRLAWSTCAQMGFMLMECGLGLYDLALLHLVAHSLYKAHAFLTAGDTVAQVRTNDLLPGKRGLQTLGHSHYRLLALPVSALVVLASVLIWQALGSTMHLHWVAGLLIAIGFAPLLWKVEAATMQQTLHGAFRVALLTQLYLVWHTLFSQLVPTPETQGTAQWVHEALSVLCGALFLALYLIQVAVVTKPRGALARGLYPWAYGGFFLDERFTRLTFQWWPVRYDQSVSTTPAAARPATQGESL